MAYSATINDEVFFSTDSISPALGLASAVLDKKAGAAGLFSFTALPNNKFYDDFHLIEDYIDVYRNEDLLWSGRVTHVSQTFDLSKKIEAQGLLSVLNDSIIRPFLHEGTLYQLLSLLIASHNSQVEAKKRITIGTIDISDAACYRAYENYETTYSRLSDLVDSFGGYLSIRKVDNTLYLDWKEITAHSVQTVDFGENLLDITKASDTENYISVLIPLGAQVEDEETGERYRVTIESVNGGRDYISVPYATNKIVGVQTWDDVHEPLILLHKGEAWLNAQNILKTKIEVTAVDLADCGYNINNFDVGMVIGVTSRPHSLDNQTFECLEQSLDLLAPDKDKLTLGGVVDGFTIRSQKEARMNTRIIERIDANYTTNKRLNDIRTLLNQDIQENYTLIEQNSESIVLLAEQVQNVAHVFYNYPVPPYSQGDLWYAGTKRSAIPGYAIPGYSIPSETEEIYICNVDKTAEQSFDRSDWQRVYGAKFNMIETLNRRVTTAEINIDAANGRIDLNASDIDNLNDDISSVEIAMDALNTELTLKVDKTDYNAAEIALMINDSGSTIKIQADHISLEGVVTANNNFKILSDGSMEAVNGKFTGVITTTSGTIGGFSIETNSIHTKNIPVTSNSAGSVALTTADFSRSILTSYNQYGSGVYESVGMLRFAIGDRFAVDKAGAIYAAQAKLAQLSVCNWIINYDRVATNNFVGNPGAGATQTALFTTGLLVRYYTSASAYKYFQVKNTSDVDSTSNWYTTGSCAASSFPHASDIRLKTDVKSIPYEDSIKTIMGLSPVQYRFKDDLSNVRHGFVAQDVQSLVGDEWGIVREFDAHDDTGKDIGKRLYLEYTELIADLVTVVQEMHNEIEELKHKGE